MNDTLKRALAALDEPWPPGVDVLDVLRQRRSGVKNALDSILAGPVAEQRDLRASEQRDFDNAAETIRKLDDRIAELSDTDARRTLAAQTRVAAGAAGTENTMSSTTTNPRGTVYQRTPGAPSFFRDLASARLQGDPAAAERLARSAAESRALGNTGAAGGSGGDFAPPAWLVDEFVKLARPGRVTADRCTKLPLPSGVSSVNIPRVATGTTTAVQSTQNTAVSQTDMTTNSLTSGIVTIAGKQVVSLQLLDQSGVALDQVILGDLAADAAKQLDLQVLTGTGTGGQVTGILNVSGAQAITYTQATPAVAGAGGFYATVNKAISSVATSRFASPDCIVMHPRRWSWVAAAFDGQNRPLVSPSGNAFNQVADSTSVDAQGPVGQMAGLPVYLDPNIPVNLGAGTNEDRVLVARMADLYLWESQVAMETFTQPYADSMGVLFRAHQYLSFQGARYPVSIAIISGTGLVAPVY